MQVKTKSGFKCDINDKILDDWRFTRAVAKTHADDDVERMNAAVDLVSLILRDNEEAYYKYVEKKNGGIVSEDIVTKDLVSIIEQVKAIKNS
jgi:bacterioferritin (cytochrome b1)